MRLVGIALAAVLVLASCATTTSEQVLFQLNDPRGDDHGGGTLAYPMSREIGPGDLDLVSLTARRGSGGTIFDATFARPIRQPEDQTIDSVGTSLQDVARLGFYTFNIDIYVDQDRLAGSGRTSALPGRNIAIDDAHAWERAVSLMPRPLESRAQLRRIMTNLATKEMREDERNITPADIEKKREDVSTDVDRYVYFPTEVRVGGGRVSFFVPDSFFGNIPQPTWSYTVVVTGADLMQRINLLGALGLANDTGDDNLGVLPMVAGRAERTFGGRRDDDRGQSPVIDIIVPAGESQEKILNDYDPRGRRPARLKGVVPQQ